MIKLKDILKEAQVTLGKVYTAKDNPPFKTQKQIDELKAMSGKPELKDYIRDGKIFGKIVKFDTWKGMKLAYIDPTSGMHQKYKGGSLVGYEYKRLIISTLSGGRIERNVGRPIWVPK